VRQRKGTTFLLRISLFNMQCNSTKFSTRLLVGLLLVNIIIDVRPTHLISAIYTNLRTFLCKSVTYDITSLTMTFTEEDRVTG